MTKNLINFFYKDLLSTKEKEQAVKTICKMQTINQKANQRIKFMLRSELKPEKIFEYKTLQIEDEHFKNVLNKLDPINLMIIQNDFISKKQNWSEFYFSKNTYYQKRQNAIEEFLYFYFR